MNAQEEQRERTVAWPDTPGCKTAVTTSNAESLPAGTAMGDYVIREAIGRGGMGVVYRAEHVSTRRCVALKVMHPWLARLPDGVRQFQCEAATLARLSHPNIVARIDADMAHRPPFLVLEHVRGLNLAQWIRAKGPLTLTAAVNRILQVAPGLAHAHARRVVHRDVKPGNLLVDGHGRIKIVDFGLACSKDATSERDTALCPFASPVGTPDYMSPEQAVDANAADHRSDIYGLGCTLFFLVTGRPPYAAGGSADKLLAHCRASIPSLRDARRQTRCAWPACGGPRVEREVILKRLDAVFRKMVAKRPEDRYASMHEVIAALTSCLPKASRIGRPCPFLARTSRNSRRPHSGKSPRTHTP